MFVNAARTKPKQPMLLTHWGVQVICEENSQKQVANLSCGAWLNLACLAGHVAPATRRLRHVKRMEKYPMSLGGWFGD